MTGYRKLVFAFALVFTSFSFVYSASPELLDTGIVGTTIQGAGDTIVLTFDVPVAPVDGTWSVNEFDFISSPTSTPLTLTNALFSPSAGTTSVLTITLNENLDFSYFRNGDTILVRPASSTIQDDLGNFVENIDVTSSTTITGDTSFSPNTCGLTFSSNNSSSTLAKIGDILTVTVTFFEKVRPLVIKISDRIATTTNTSTNVSACGDIWSATIIASSSDSEGLLGYSIESFEDLAGNQGNYPIASPLSAGSLVFLDKTLPTLSISLSDTEISIGETATATFTFSEPVLNFDTSDITVLNGTLSTATSGDSGITWTSLFTPENGTTSLNTVISVNMTGLNDRAGNVGTSTATSSLYGVDTLRPTLIITSTDLDLASPAESAIITFTFSERVLNFSTTSITRVDSGTLTVATSADGGKTWTSTFNPAGTTVSPTNLISVLMTGITDLFGNAGVGTTSSQNYNVNTIIVAFSSSGGGGGGGGGSINYYPPSSPYVNVPIGEVLGSSATAFTYTKNTFTRDLVLGSRGEDVKELQKVLVLEGFLTTPPTTYFGLITKRALIKWQEKNNLPATGYFGAMSRNVLVQKITTHTAPSVKQAPQVLGVSITNTIPTRNLTLGSRGTDVTELQKILVKEGVFTEEPTGYFGNLTKEALTKWQSKNNLPATGYFGPMSREVMRKNYTQ